MHACMQSLSAWQPSPAPAPPPKKKRDANRGQHGRRHLEPHVALHGVRNMPRCPQLLGALLGSSQVQVREHDLRVYGDPHAPTSRLAARCTAEGHRYGVATRHAPARTTPKPACCMSLPLRTHRTLAPSRASVRPHARPIPRAPPVTSATLPARRGPATAATVVVARRPSDSSGSLVSPPPILPPLRRKGGLYGWRLHLAKTVAGGTRASSHNVCV